MRGEQGHGEAKKKRTKVALYEKGNPKQYVDKGDWNQSKPLSDKTDNGKHHIKALKA